MCYVLIEVKLTIGHSFLLHLLSMKKHNISHIVILVYLKQIGGVLDTLFSHIQKYIGVHWGDASASFLSIVSVVSMVVLQSNN